MSCRICRPWRVCGQAGRTIAVGSIDFYRIFTIFVGRSEEKVSPMERTEVQTVVKAMDEEEQRVAAEKLPDEILFAEIGRRVEKLEERVGGIIQIVTGQEPQIESMQMLSDFKAFYNELSNMYFNLRNQLLGKKNDR